MEARELRIGNLIKTSQGIFKVYSTNQLEIMICPFLSNEPFFIFINTAKPIVLTEEWLLKLGFVYHKYDDGVYGFCRRGFGYINAGQIRWNCEGILFNDDGHLLYVHQLQNTYFALTGEELTIKE